MFHPASDFILYLCICQTNAELEILIDNETDKNLPEAFVGFIVVDVAAIVLDDAVCDVAAFVLEDVVCDVGEDVAITVVGDVYIPEIMTKMIPEFIEAH